MGRKRFKRKSNINLGVARKPGEINHVLDLKQVRSHEYFAELDGRVLPVLDGIDLDIYAGEVWAVTATRAYTVGLLLDVIGNVRSFDTGTAMITEQDMPQQKKIILPDVFNIGSGDMLYEDMNVLQFISFATQKSTMLDELNAPASQKNILDFLVAADLAYISLSKIAYLSLEERVLITMICACYSQNSLIVINQPQMRMIGRLRDSFAYIVGRMREQVQTVVFATADDYDLIEASASHIAYIQEGKMVYAGEVDLFKRTYDKVAFVLTPRRPQYAYDTITDLLPDYQVSLEHNKIVIRDPEAAGSPDDMDVQYLYAQIREAELWIEQVYINEKSIVNAIKEVKRANTLPL